MLLRSRPILSNGMKPTMRSILERKKNRKTIAPMETMSITHAASFISLSVASAAAGRCTNKSDQPKSRMSITESKNRSTIIVERFFDSVMLILLFGWSLLFVHLPAAADDTLRLMKDAAWVMLIVSIGAIVFLFFFRSNIDRIVGFIPFDRIGRLLRSFSQGLSFLQRGSSLGWILFHSFLTWVLITLQFWTMMLGMNFRFSLEAATLVMVGAALGSIAQVPGIGGGFQAGYVFGMTTFFQVPAEQAIATSLVAWVASYVPTVAMAGYYMISHGLSLKDLRTHTP